MHCASVQITYRTLGKKCCRPVRGSCAWPTSYMSALHSCVVFRTPEGKPCVLWCCEVPHHLSSFVRFGTVLKNLVAQNRGETNRVWCPARLSMGERQRSGNKKRFSADFDPPGCRFRLYFAGLVLGLAGACGGLRVGACGGLPGFTVRGLSGLWGLEEIRVD